MGCSGCRRKRVCLMRCQNKALNGPFGGCIAFQQWVPKPVTTKKVPTTTADNPDETETPEEPTTDTPEEPESTAPAEPSIRPPPSYNNDARYAAVGDNYKDGTGWTDPGYSQYSKRSEFDDEHGNFDRKLFDRYVTNELDEESSEAKPKLRFDRN